MVKVLLVADAAWVVNDVRAALAEERFEILEVTDPRIAAEEWYEEEPDIVVVDLQISSMGGFAVTRSLRETAGAVLEDPPPTILLLDRAADTFLAGRAGADAWLLKPFTGFALRDLVDRLVVTPAGEPSS